jgi:hypothetical protein
LIFWIRDNESFSINIAVDERVDNKMRKKMLEQEQITKKILEESNLKDRW